MLPVSALLTGSDYLIDNSDPSLVEWWPHESVHGFANQGSRRSFLSLRQRMSPLCPGWWVTHTHTQCHCWCNFLFFFPQVILKKMLKPEVSRQTIAERRNSTAVSQRVQVSHRTIWHGWGLCSVFDTEVTAVTYGRKWGLNKTTVAKNDRYEE